MNNIYTVPCTVDYKTFVVSRKVDLFKPGLTTPIGWFVTSTDCSKSVRKCCVIEVFGGVYVLSFGFVGIGGFAIGLSQISFFSLHVTLNTNKLNKKL